MDKLEKFVRENRQAFDAETAKDFIWEGIEAKLNEQAESKGITKVVSLRSRIYSYAKVAAIGLVLLTIGGFLGSYWTVQNQEKQFSFGVINEEYQELETFYAAQVNLQLNRLRKRSYFDIIIESAEPREPHHFATLFGYGASAVNPYMVNEIIRMQVKEGFITDMDEQGAVDNFNLAIGKGLLKVMNKIGISTLHSYRGSQIFEIVGFSSQFVEKYFPYTCLLSTYDDTDEQH